MHFFFLQTIKNLECNFKDTFVIKILKVLIQLHHSSKRVLVLKHFFIYIFVDNLAKLAMLNIGRSCQYLEFQVG